MTKFAKNRFNIMICPQCRTPYPEDDLFCPLDGNALVSDENEQETFVNSKIPTSLPRPAGEGFHGTRAGGPVYDDTIVFPLPVVTGQPRPAASQGAGRNILFVVIGMCIVVIALLTYLVANISLRNDTAKDTGPGGKSNANSSPSPNPSITVDNRPQVNNNLKTEDSFDRNNGEATPKPPILSLPDRIERAYRGTSYVPNGNLPLTLSFKRDGSRLTGSAKTPGDWDDLDGNIQPDGTFDVAGNNRLAGRITGNWRGRIDENGVINGVWTSTSGKRVRFYAKY
jgi:hypothetical protein